jgi:hypothetical protein
MSRMLSRILDFARWLAAPDRLPGPARPAREASPRGSSFLRRVVAAERLAPSPPRSAKRRRGLLRRVFGPDDLARVDPPPSGGAARTGFVRWLLGPDELPVAAAPAGRKRTGFLRWLLRPAELPMTVAPADRKRTGFLRWLLRPAELPMAAAPADRERTGFLRWLLARDAL